MTPDQVKDALALLQWSRERLAAWSVVPIQAVKDFELGKVPVSLHHLSAMRMTLVDAGVEFVDGDPPTVRLRTVES